MFWLAIYTLYLAPPWIWVPLGASLRLLRHAKISRRTPYIRLCNIMKVEKLATKRVRQSGEHACLLLLRTGRTHRETREQKKCSANGHAQSAQQDGDMLFARNPG